MNSRRLTYWADLIRKFVLCAITGLVVSRAALAVEITQVTANRDEICISGRGDRQEVGIVELAPYQGTNDLAAAAVVGKSEAKRSFKIKIPRWDGARDRLYSGFLAFTETNATRLPGGAIRFVEEMRGIAKYDEAFPRAASKKGLQVQMPDDAIALGVKHAAVNVDLASLLDLGAAADAPAWQMDGTTYHFRLAYVEALDQRIKKLSDAGMTVTLILLCYESPAPAINKIMLHPRYSPNAPHKLSAFNTATADGLRYFKACMEFLADRYSQPGHPHGRAVNFIVGNEVNSHWEWANLGDATMEEFADDYLRTVRICNTAVHKISATSRVYISLEHHWNARFDGPMHSFEGRRFVDYFNARAKAGGDFDWNLAYHPYPEDLTNPRTWNDKSATLATDTRRITFKNLEMLPFYFGRKELLFRGERRHIILSEQGFNTLNVPEGELWQAAGFCYAYYKVARIPGIDSFILHRHVDHRDEFGLNLGLWRRNEKSDSPAEPGTKKMIYDVFKKADTPEWNAAFAFALPVIGIKSWDDITPKTDRELRRMLK